MVWELFKYTGATISFVRNKGEHKHLTAARPTHSALVLHGGSCRRLRSELITAAGPVDAWAAGHWLCLSSGEVAAWFHWPQCLQSHPRFRPRL